MSTKRNTRERGWLGKLSDRLDLIPDADVGAMFKEYLRESVHGGFDGFSARDLVGAKNLIEDVGLFIEHYDGKPLYDYAQTRQVVIDYHNGDDR